MEGVNWVHFGNCKTNPKDSSTTHLRISLTTVGVSPTGLVFGVKHTWCLARPMDGHHVGHLEQRVVRIYQNEETEAINTNERSGS